MQLLEIMFPDSDIILLGKHKARPRMYCHGCLIEHNVLLANVEEEELEHTGFCLGYPKWRPNLDFLKNILTYIITTALLKNSGEWLGLTATDQCGQNYAHVMAGVGRSHAPSLLAEMSMHGYIMVGRYIILTGLYVTKYSLVNEIT